MKLTDRAQNLCLIVEKLPPSDLQMEISTEASDLEALVSQMEKKHNQLVNTLHAIVIEDEMCE